MFALSVSKNCILKAFSKHNYTSFYRPAIIDVTYNIICDVNACN